MHFATVYDPHPGEGGCTKPLPESLRLAAESMTGRRLPIAEIIETLRDSVDDGAFSIRDDYIGYGSGRQIYIPCAPPGLMEWQYNWRVVRIER